MAEIACFSCPPSRLPARSWTDLHVLPCTNAFATPGTHCTGRTHSSFSCCCRCPLDAFDVPACQRGEVHNENTGRETHLHTRHKCIVSYDSPRLGIPKCVMTPRKRATLALRTGPAQTRRRFVHRLSSSPFISIVAHAPYIYHTRPPPPPPPQSAQASAPCHPMAETIAETLGIPDNQSNPTRQSVQSYSNPMVHIE